MLLVVGAFLVMSANAQFPDRRNKEEQYPDSIKERLIKLKIEEDKKDHETLLKQSEEIALLSGEIEKSFVKNRSLTSKDKEKLDRVEDLLKKVRRELRAGKDDDDDDNKTKPNSLDSALSSLHQNTLKLFEEVKKTSRHSISVVAIQSSNAVLKLVEFIRFKN